MCATGVACCSMDCCVSELVLKKIYAKRNGLVKVNIISIISSKCNLFSSWYNCSITHLSLNNNHSLTQDNLISEMSIVNSEMRIFYFQIMDKYDCNKNVSGITFTQSQMNMKKQLCNILSDLFPPLILIKMK
jgi:hypothetical protein